MLFQHPKLPLLFEICCFYGTTILTIHNKLNGLETKVLMARVPQNSHGCFHWDEYIFRYTKHTYYFGVIRERLRQGVRGLARARHGFTMYTTNSCRNKPWQLVPIHFGLNKTSWQMFTYIFSLIYHLVR